MIKREGFDKGQEVEFQDYRHCWVRGTVQCVEPASWKQEGPSGALVCTDPGCVHVVYKTRGELRVRKLNPKRVRAVTKR